MAMVDSGMSLKLRNSLSELNMLSQKLEEFAESLSLSPRTLFEIRLALEELLTNIISYGYTDNADHWIRIAIMHEDGILTVRVADDGIPFDPLSIEEPDCQCPIEQRKIGKLGIHLVKRFTDGMVYERRGNQNILTLRKKVAFQ